MPAEIVIKRARKLIDYANVFATDRIHKCKQDATMAVMHLHNSGSCFKNYCDRLQLIDRFNVRVTQIVNSELA